MINALVSRSLVNSLMKKIRGAPIVHWPIIGRYRLLLFSKFQIIEWQDATQETEYTQVRKQSFNVLLDCILRLLFTYFQISFLHD